MTHRSVRRLLSAALTLVAAGGLEILIAQDAVPPAASAAASSPVTPAQAQPFLGDWTVASEGPQGPTSFALTMKVADGKVAGEISSSQMPAKQAISEISKAGESLILKYTLDYQGMAVPVMVTLTPSADTLKVAFDFAGGQFMMAGTGTKKK